MSRLRFKLKLMIVNFYFSKLVSNTGILKYNTMTLVLAYCNIENLHIDLKEMSNKFHFSS